jgi:catechol 2,3-dioxygenase-like lactoylglutathione lyase family enzyme
MRINLTSVLVDDQAAALRFYTEVLGFVKKTEIPLGEHAWLTVVSPDQPRGLRRHLRQPHPDRRPGLNDRTAVTSRRHPTSRAP